MAYHLTNSLFYLHGTSVGDPISFLGAFRYYPPLTYWVTDVFYVVLGNEAMWVAVLSNAVWLAVLVFSTYGVGSRLWSSRVGWISVVFVVTAPMIVTVSKEYMLDMPLTAVAALSLYLLIRADGFSSRRYSLLLGATIGCGLLVKWTLPLVLLFPTIHAVAIALSKVRLHREFDRLANAFAAAGLTCLIAGTWYIHNFLKVAGAARVYNSPEEAQGGNATTIATPASALWYLWRLLDTQLYIVPTVMLLVGIAYCFRRREVAARNIYPILMATGTYVTFSLLPNKDPRFTLPMIPALAVIASSWLTFVPKRVGASIAAAFIAYSALTFFAVSFGTSLLPNRITLNVPDTSFAPSDVTLFGQHGYIIGPPTHEKWHQADPFRTIARAPPSERAFSYTGPSTIWFNRNRPEVLRPQIRGESGRRRQCSLSSRSRRRHRNAGRLQTSPKVAPARRWHAGAVHPPVATYGHHSRRPPRRVRARIPRERVADGQALRRMLVLGWVASSTRSRQSGVAPNASSKPPRNPTGQQSKAPVSASTNFSKLLDHAGEHRELFEFLPHRTPHRRSPRPHLGRHRPPGRPVRVHRQLGRDRNTPR